MSFARPAPAAAAPSAPDDNHDLTASRAFPARSSRNMVIGLAIAVDAYLVGAEARNEHMGWGSEEWSRLARQLDADIPRILAPKT